MPETKTEPKESSHFDVTLRFAALERDGVTGNYVVDPTTGQPKVYFESIPIHYPDISYDGLVFVEAVMNEVMPGVQAKLLAAGIERTSDPVNVKKMIFGSGK